MIKRVMQHCLCLLVVLLAAQVQAAGKPNIVILATGGTIAGSAASQTQAGYTFTDTLNLFHCIIVESFQFSRAQ